MCKQPSLGLAGQSEVVGVWHSHLDNSVMLSARHKDAANDLILLILS